jgi:hypothetical protein
MSDREIIIQLLRSVEWRLRANRLLREFMLGASVVLAFLVGFKLLGLFIPMGAAAVTAADGACALLLVGALLWRFRQKESLDRAAASVDQKAGLKDEIKTAFWFIRNPRSSDWIDGQINRAARKASKIDVPRAYPGTIPRASYIAAAMVVLLIGLNFVALPGLSRVAPDSAAVRTAFVDSSLDLQDTYAGLDEIAAELRKVDRLKAMADALAERRLNDAADELRRLSVDLNGDSLEYFQNISETFQAVAAGNSREALRPLAQDLAAAAKALMNNDTASAQEGLEDAAQDLEGLDEEIYKQESTLDQLAPGNERRGEQDGQVAGAPIPDTRDFPQESAGSEGLGASGGKAESGPRRAAPTTLDVKLEEEGLQGVANAGINRVEIEEASRQERSKLDYRNVKSELTAAQKDAMKHESTPWKYRPLIKGYFQSIPELTENK